MERKTVHIVPAQETLFADVPTPVGVWCREVTRRQGAEVITGCESCGGRDGFHVLPYQNYDVRAIERCRELEADIVHVHTLNEVTPGLREALPSAKIVLHLHSEWAKPDELGPIDGQICCSRYILAKYKSFQGHSGVVNYAVDTSLFTPNRSSESEGLNLLYVGRLSPERGLHDLVTAFEDIVRTFPQATLTLVGSWISEPREMVVGQRMRTRILDLLAPYESRYETWLQNLLTSLGRERLQVLGERPRTQLPEVYRSADIFLFPSAWDEPCGLPVLEAMACGLPVVAMNSAGLRDLVVEGQTGLMVSPYNHVALSEAVEKIASDPELARKLGEAGRERVLSRFTWDLIAEQTKSFYQDIF